MHRFEAIRSYKIDTLCSHSLPSFIEQETFYEITIKKCLSLRQIKAFTFYKYTHLKSLLLTANNFSHMDANAFRYLTHLERLDLSSNPITHLDDHIFRDMSSLKRLFLESTLLKQISAHTLAGLVSLNELHLSKSYQLASIEGRAFKDFKRTLRELHLKDTVVKLIDTLIEDGIEPPYTTTMLDMLRNYENNHVWLDGLNLTVLNMDSSASNEQFSFKTFDNTSKNSLMCKVLRYLAPTTLVNLQRNQTCNCLVYLVYRHKEFKASWEYVAPYCYRKQMLFNAAGGAKSFEAIVKREMECDLNGLHKFCYPPTTTTTSTISTTTTSI